MADAQRACRQCQRPAVAGADRCLRCGGELEAGRRPVSPFGGAGGRRNAAWLATGVFSAVVLGTALLVTWQEASSAPRQAPGRSQPERLPALRATLTAAGVPPRAAIVRLRTQDVQESCMARWMPGDLEVPGRLPAVIDGNQWTSWHCDGDGARLRPAQSVTVFFTRTVTLTEVGVRGYDPFRPCRFVTMMAMVTGSAAYQLYLPAAPYPALRWFRVPDVRTDHLRLVVLRTAVTPGGHGPSCGRTAIAKIGFATRT